MSEPAVEGSNDDNPPQQESEDSFLKNLDEAATVEEKLLEITNKQHNPRLTSLTANRAVRQSRAPTRGVRPGAKLQLKATTDDVSSSNLASRKSVIFKGVPQVPPAEEPSNAQPAEESANPRRHTMAPAQANFAAQAMAARTGLRKATVATTTASSSASPSQPGSKPAAPNAQEPEWKDRLRQRRQRTLTKEEQKQAINYLAEEEKKENKAVAANTPAATSTTDTKPAVRRTTVTSPQPSPATTAPRKGSIGQTTESPTSPKTAVAPKAAVKPATPPAATKPVVQPRKGSNAEPPKSPAEQPKATEPQQPQKTVNITEQPKPTQPTAIEQSKNQPELPKEEPKSRPVSITPVEQKTAVTVTPQQATPPSSPAPVHAPGSPSTTGESSPKEAPRRPTRPSAPIPKVIVEDSEDDAPPKKAQPQPPQTTTPSTEPPKSPEPKSPEPSQPAKQPEEPKPTSSTSTQPTQSTSNPTINNNNNATQQPDDFLNYFVDESGKLRYFDGFLQKRSMKHSRGAKKWKRRWFKLSDEELIYYKDIVPKDTYIRERPPVGVIHLRDIESITQYHKYHAFELKTRDRSYILDAEDDVDLQDWISCLKVAVEQVATMRERSASEAVNAPWFHSNLPGQVERKEGPLEVRENSKWKQRWVILQGGSIVIRKSQKDKKTVSKISLYHSKLGDYLPEKHPFCFMVASESKSIAFKTKSEQEFHEWLNVIQFQKVVLEETVDFITL